MAIGIFAVLFAAVSVVSVLGILLLFLLKEEKGQKICLYIMGAWGMCIAAFHGLSLPGNWIGGQIAAWGLGLMSAAGIVVCAGAEGEGKRQLASILVAVSIAGGVLRLFSII